MSLFDPLRRVAVAISSITLDQIMLELSKDREVTDLIVELNTREQLYNKGVDSTGSNLEDIGGFYSFQTVIIKKEKGQPTDRVTLRDTGKFYDSWRVFLDSNHDFEISNDPIKDGVNILDRWGKNVLGLTDESQAKFNDLVRQKVPDIVLNLIQKAAA